MSHLLRANTAVDVLIGPFVDSTNGNDDETGLTITQADVRLSKNAQNMAQKADANACTHDEIGYFNCPLNTTDTDTEGQLDVMVHESGALHVKGTFDVISEAAWDSLFAAKDVGFMDVNIKTVGRADAQETEANNLESACANYSVTRGLTGTAVPAAVAAAAGGIPLSTAGSLEMDTLADWVNGARLDLILDIIAADTTTDIPALIATAQADLDIITDADGVIVGAAGATAIIDEFETQSQADPTGFHINVKEVNGTAQTANDNGADINEILTGTPTLKYMGYYGPGVYIDSGAANETTVTGTDGTIGNPVSTFAAARTIADAIGLNRYYLEGNSDITLGATHLDWEFCGVGSVADNILNLGSQDVSRSRFCNLCIEGTQGGAGRIEAIECALQDPGAGATTLHIFSMRCGLVDDISVDTSNDNVFEGWYSLVAGGSTPIIRATGAAGTIAMRHGSGGIELAGLSASHNVSVETDGQVIFNADCNVNANVSIRGVMDITDNTAGMNSLSQNAAINMSKINAECDTALSDYDPSTNTEMLAAFTEIKGATWASGTDTLEHIRNKQTDIETDTAEIGAAGAGLTNIDLPNQTMDIVGNITGNLSGSVGSLTGHTNQTADHTAAIADIPTVAEFNARTLASADYVVVGDTLARVTLVDTVTTNTDLNTAQTEPGQGAPAVNATPLSKLAYLYKAWRNKKDNDGTTRNLYADDASTVDQKSGVGEAAGTVTTDEWETGP